MILNTMKPFIFLLPFPIFFSCHSNESAKTDQAIADNISSFKQEDIAKIWKLSNIDFNSREEDETDVLLNDAVNNTLLEEGFLLCLFPNGQMTELVNHEFNAGKWRTVKDKNAILIERGDLVDTIDILEITTKRNKEYLSTKYTGLGNMEFVNVHSMLEHYKDDPFYPTNNLWREKPDSLETEKELKLRLKNYVRHVTFILKAAMERESQIISFEHSQGIIKIYNGGIGVVPKKSIPKEWFANFFNEEQALFAREFYRQYLMAGDYKGATTGSWVEDDYKILLGLYRRIDEDIKQMN